MRSLGLEIGAGEVKSLWESLARMVRRENEEKGSNTTSSPGGARTVSQWTVALCCVAWLSSRLSGRNCFSLTILTPRTILPWK